MAKCDVTGNNFMTPELRNEIEEGHKDLFIKDLGAVKQEEVVKFLSHKMYREAVAKPDYSTKDLKREFVASLTTKINTTTKLINKIKSSPVAMKAHSKALVDQIGNVESLKIILDNVNSLIGFTKREFKLMQGVTAVNIGDQLDQDLIASDVKASEVERDRTSFSDDFSLMINSKAKVSGKLKAFLSFVKNKRFTDISNTEDVQTFFGTESYMEFGLVYDELHRILSDLQPDFKSMIDTLEAAYDDAKDNSKHHRAWLEDLIVQLKRMDDAAEVAKNPDLDTIKYLFVRDMAQHRVQSKFVYAINRFDHVKNTWETFLTVQDDNASTAGVRLHKEWKNTHIHSPLVDQTTLIYDEKLVKELSDRLNVLTRRAKKIDYDDKVAVISRVFDALGMISSPEFVDAVVKDKIKVYHGVDSSVKLTGISKMLKKLIDTKMYGEVNPGKMDDSFVRGLAKQAAKYNKNDYSNMMRVGTKLISAYTSNHNFSNRVRDIKAGKGLSNLDNSVFSGHSAYWDLIGRSYNKEHPENLDWFGMEYVSLFPLAKSSEKQRRVEGATTLSDLDMEVLYVGNAFQKGASTVMEESFSLPTGEEVKLDTQDGSFLTPTLSDRSRAMMLKGLTFRISELVFNEETNKNELVMRTDAIDTYIATVIMSEVSRIKANSDPSFSEELNMTSFEGDLFYFTPYLNNVYVTRIENNITEVPEDSEGAISLTEAISKGEITDQEFKELVHEKVTDDLHEKAQARYNAWGSASTSNSKGLGLIDENGFFSKHKEVNSVAFPKRKAKAMELALDLTFSEEMAMANFFQMIAGDPAQYFKLGKPLEGDTKTAKNFKDIQSTALNITKRLASEIAPGDEADITEDPEYYQIFLEDIPEKSDMLDQYVEILDPDRYNEYKKLVEDTGTTDEIMEDFMKGLISYPYYNINTTDAQEYLTWKTQLKEMRRYGELTKEEYDKAYSALTGNIPLTGELLTKVLGPRKPVHSSTIPQHLGNGTNYYRKTFIKSATFVLLPQFIKGTRLDVLRRAMERLEKDENKPVRAAYQSAVKVGFPAKGLSLIKSTGEWRKRVSFTKGKDALILQTSGLRMQQSIPYSKDKTKIKVGTQPKKLLFTGLLEELFNYKGKSTSGRDLKTIYDKLFFELTQAGLSELNAIVRNKDRSVNYRYLSKLLKSELVSRKETSKPLYDGLVIDKDTGTFRTPLGRSAYSKEYMALLNSIIFKYVIDKETKGQSNTIGSNAGITSWEDVTSLGGTIYVDGYDPTTPLAPMHKDKGGNTVPAELLVPFKFPDAEGNLVAISTVITDGKLDFTKIDPAALESFGFRIPNQLHSSMTYAKIVGFLPEAMGDMVVAPKEFVSQMGSDFDADKLYSYLPNTEVTDEGIISTLDSVSKEEMNDALTYIDNKIAKFYRDLKKEIKDGTKKAIRNNVAMEALKLTHSKGTKEYFKLKKELNTAAWSNFKETYKDVEEDITSLKQTEFEDIRKLELEKIIIKDNYIKSLEDKMLGIHRVVMLAPATLSKIVKPLSSGEFENSANDIETLRAGEDMLAPSVISYRYNKDQINDGNQGKTGVSIFSSDSILQSYLEGKGVRMRWKRPPVVELGETSGALVPLEVNFGNTYGKSNGELGINTPLKKDGDPVITPALLIAALQNISVDNATLRVMSRINMNNRTADVYALLSMLRFEEDISAYFMSQQILIDYVKQLNNKTGAFAPYSPNAEKEVIKNLIATYDSKYNELYDNDLADFKGQNAHSVLREMIKNPTAETDFDYGKMQVSILKKFLLFKKNSRNLNSAKQFLNLDSKGLDKNFFNTARLIQDANNLPNNPILKLYELLGGYKKVSDSMYEFTAPETLAGDDIFYGAKTLINTFGDEFIESNPDYHFTQVIDKIESTMGRRLNDSEVYYVRNELNNYLNSDLRSVNPKSFRESLFFDTSLKGLYGKLTDLKNTPYGKNNAFIDSLNVTVERGTGEVAINFDKVPGDNYQDSAIYNSFISMLMDTGSVSGLYDEIIPSDIAQLLVYYGVLKGGNAGQSFLRFVPPQVLSTVINDFSSVDINTFVSQFFQNNTSMAPVITKNMVKTKEGDVLKLTDESNIPSAVVYGSDKNLYLLTDPTLLEYTKSDKYETPYVSNYTFQSDEKTYDDAFLGNANSSVSGFISELDETTAFDIYDAFSGSNMSDSKRVLMASIRNSGTSNNVKVRLVSDPEMDATASYDINTNEIIINKLRVEKVSDDYLAKVMLHEHMHNRIVPLLDRYAKDSNSVTPEESESIERIQEHIYNTVTQITEDSGENRAEQFRKYLWFRFSTLSPTILANIDKTTTSPFIKKELKEILKTINKHKAKAKDVIYKKFDNFKHLETYLSSNVGEETLFSTMSTIYEYTAIVPSEVEAFMDKSSSFNQSVYSKVVSNITKLLKAVFKRIGIKPTSLKGALDDIYSLARVKPTIEYIEIKPKIVYKDDIIRIVDNSLVYESTGNIVEPNTPKYRDIVKGFVGTFKGKATKWKSYQKKAAIAIADHPKASLVEKISALDMLTGVRPRTTKVGKAVRKLERNLLKGDIEVDVNAPGSIPKSTKKVKKNPKRKTKSERDIYYEKVSSVSTRTTKTTKDNTSVQDINEIEYKTLIAEGEEAMIDCGVTTRKVSRKWSVIKATPAFVAANGALIENTRVTNASSWVPIEASMQNSYAYGGISQYNNGVDSKTSWEVVTKLKGPTHAQGGIDLVINNGKVSYSRGGTVLKAAHGMFIAAE